MMSIGPYLSSQGSPFVGAIEQLVMVGDSTSGSKQCSYETPVSIDSHHADILSFTASENVEKIKLLTYEPLMYSESLIMDRSFSAFLLY